MKEQDLNNLGNLKAKDMYKNIQSLQSLDLLEEIESLKSAQDKTDSMQSHNAPTQAILESAQKDSILHATKAHSTDTAIKKQEVYISVGDINGVGLELILRNHDSIKEWFCPFYCVDEAIIKEAARLLGITMPSDMAFIPINMQDTVITPGVVCEKSGAYSFESFVKATSLSLQRNAPLVTLPIHKYAWQKAGISYAGHTQYLRERFQRNAIMMLGCEEMFVALFTDHIPLHAVAGMIQKESLLQFLRNFYHVYTTLLAPTQNLKQPHTIYTQPHKDTIALHKNMKASALKKHAINAKMVGRLLHDTQLHDISQGYTFETNMPYKNTKNMQSLQIAVLGLNPHAGDNGVLGQEDFIINECIDSINNEIGEEIFVGAFAPDSAFIPSNRKLYKIFIAMYHDSGLAPLKALYFDKSINVSIHLPILRVSPDHGTCFDKAYKNDGTLCMDSYLECFGFLLRHHYKKKQVLI